MTLLLGHTSLLNCRVEKTKTPHSLHKYQTIPQHIQPADTHLLPTQGTSTIAQHGLPLLHLHLPISHSRNRSVKQTHKSDPRNSLLTPRQSSTQLARFGSRSHRPYPTSQLQATSQTGSTTSTTPSAILTRASAIPACPQTLPATPKQVCTAPTSTWPRTSKRAIRGPVSTRMLSGMCTLS